MILGTCPVVPWKCSACPADILSNLRESTGRDVPDVPGTHPLTVCGTLPRHTDHQISLCALCLSAFLLPNLELEPTHPLHGSLRPSQSLKSVSPGPEKSPGHSENTLPTFSGGLSRDFQDCHQDFLETFRVPGPGRHVRDFFLAFRA